MYLCKLSGALELSISCRGWGRGEAQGRKRKLGGGWGLQFCISVNCSIKFFPQKLGSILSPPAFFARDNSFVPHFSYWWDTERILTHPGTGLSQQKVKVLAHLSIPTLTLPARKPIEKKYHVHSEQVNWLKPRVEIVFLEISPGPCFHIAPAFPSSGQPLFADRKKSEETARHSEHQPTAHSLSQTPPGSCFSPRALGLLWFRQCVVLFLPWAPCHVYRHSLSIGHPFVYMGLHNPPTPRYQHQVQLPLIPTASAHPF